MGKMIDRKSYHSRNSEDNTRLLKGLSVIRVSDVAFFLMLCTQFCNLTGGGSLDVNLSRAAFLLYCLVSFSTDAVPLIKARKTNLPSSFCWAFLFWGFAFTSLIWSPDISSAFTPTYANNAIRIAALCFFIPIRFKHGNGLLAYLYIFLLLCGYLTLATVFKTPVSHWGTERIGSTIGLNQNNLGMLMAYGAFIALGISFVTKRRCYLLVCIPFILISLLTGSRKAFFLLISLPLLFALFYKKGIKRILIFGSCVLLAILLWRFAMLQPDLYNVIGRRLEETLSGGANLDGMREFYMQFGWSLFAEKPLLGYGMSGFKIMVAQPLIFARDIAYSHCNFIELLSCYGLIGFILYYSLYAWILATLFKALKSNETFACIGIPVILSLLITDYGNVSYPEISNLLLLMIPYLIATNFKRTHNIDK